MSTQQKDITKINNGNRISSNTPVTPEIFNILVATLVTLKEDN